MIVKLSGFVFLNMDSVPTSASTQTCMTAVHNEIFAKQISHARDRALPLWFGKLRSFVLMLLDLILHYMLPPGVRQYSSL